MNKNIHYSEFENLCSRIVPHSEIFNFGNCFCGSKNILIKWSRIYTAFLVQNREHAPETETCVPCVADFKNSFPQKFRLIRLPVGKPSFL